MSKNAQKVADKESPESLDGKGQVVGRLGITKLMGRIHQLIEAAVWALQQTKENRELITSGELKYFVVTKGEYRHLEPINFRNPLLEGEILDWIGEVEGDHLRTVQFRKETGEMSQALWNIHERKLHRIDSQGRNIARIGAPQEGTNLREICFQGGAKGTWSAAQGFLITSNPQ